MADIFTKLGIYIASPSNNDGTPRKPVPQDFQVWMTEVERLIKGLIAGAGGVDLPDLIYKYNITGGTPNNIVAVPNATPPSAPGEALFTIQTSQPNTGAVKINGKPLLTSSGNQIVAGGLVPGIWMFLDDGENFRLVSDQASQAIMNAAEQAAQAAQASRDIVENLASDAVSQGNVPIYSSRNAVEMLEIPAGITAFRTNGYAVPGDGGAALYKRAATGSAQEGFVQSADGSWWVIVEHQWSKAIAENMQVPDWTNVIHTVGMNSKSDGRGADYERYVPNGQWFTDDLKIVKDGVPYVNQRGWQRSLRKRYGRIVVAGSSTPAGMGTSDYFAPSAANGWTESPNSWVGLMRAALGNEAEIINRSYPGFNTTNFINDFWSRIAPYSPDTVILSTGWVNEPASGKEPRRAADVYNRLLTLCSMCSRIGAKPIVMITMAGGSASLIYTYGIAQALRQMGVTVWDISSSVKDRSSNSIATIYQADTTHANDAGHMRYFQNINVNDLLVDFRGVDGQQFNHILGRDGYYAVGSSPSADGDAVPLQAVFTGDHRPLDFSVHSTLVATKDSGNTITAAINIEPWSGTDHPEISIRPSGGMWALYADSEVKIVSGATADRKGIHRSEVSYDRGRNRFDYYQDGEFVGSYIPETKTPSTVQGWPWFRCCSTGSAFWGAGWEIMDFVVTRNPSMNGFGIRGANDRSRQITLALPSTMGARFALSSQENSLGMVNNIENDPSARLMINNAYARVFNRPLF